MAEQPSAYFIPQLGLLHATLWSPLGTPQIVPPSSWFLFHYYIFNITRDLCLMCVYFEAKSVYKYVRYLELYSSILAFNHTTRLFNLTLATLVATIRNHHVYNRAVHSICDSRGNIRSIHCTAITGNSLCSLAILC